MVRQSPPWRKPPGLRMRVEEPLAKIRRPETAAPTGIPSRMPGASGSKPAMASRRLAWGAEWFSFPVSPGFHPGLLG